MKRSLADGPLACRRNVGAALSTTLSVEPDQTGSNLLGHATQMRRFLGWAVMRCVDVAVLVR